MITTPVPYPLRSLPFDQLLGDLLAVSMTGMIYYTPLYAPADSGEIVDFRFEYLNPAAQRMMRMPEVPTLTHNQQWPHSQAHGTFAFHVEAYVSGEPREFNINYQADGYDNYYRLAARRSGAGLLVSFTDTADQPRSPVESALRESQAAEQAVRAEVERQRQQLQQLNQELEARIEERTAAALALQADLLAASQRQVQERETFYQIFAQTPACIALLRGPKHHFEYVNAAYQQLFPGRTLVGQALAQVLPDAAEQGFLTLLDGVYRTGETFFGTELPLAIEQPDGHPARQAYFNFTYQAYHEHGQIAGISIFAYDVAEQVLARRQREIEQQQLHELFLQAPAPIVILDGPDLVFQLINPAYQRIFPGRDLAGKPLLEALPELVGTPIPDLFQGVYQTGEPVTVHELPLLMARHEGAAPEDIYWTFTYQARRDAHGRIDGVRVFAHDVSDQVRARQVVEARETSFRLLADNVPGTLWVTDPAGECTYLSARWYATTGQTQAEGLGLGWTNAVHPDDARVAGAAFLAANARRKPFSCLFRLRQRNGEYRWVLDQGLPRFGETGAYDGMVGAVVDVHEQKLAELALQRLTAELSATNEQLTRTNVDLDNFIYTASHDLKQPIANIEGLLLALEHELPPAGRIGEVPTMLALMQQATERFGRTITHLTDISRLQQEHNQPASRVSLARVVHEVQLDLATQIAQTKARLDVRIPEEVTLYFPEKNLRSVIYNLLSNALKYRHPDRVLSVWVTYRPEATEHLLEVRDNGLGLDLAQDQDKLFGMFQRLHTHVEGSGVGLYMVKKMVENVGGRILVDSTLNQGSTFRVYFPPN